MARKTQGMRMRTGNSPDHQLRARSAPGTVPVGLPLIHVTACGIAREIVKSRQLEPRRCSVFNRNLIYLFALRPAYRLRDGDDQSHQMNRFPFVFVLKPDVIDAPFHVYPFDTGAAFAGLFNGGCDPTIPLDDYSLDPTHEAVAGQIGWAFGSLQAYFDADLRQDILSDVPYHETVTRGYVDVARLARSGSNQPDKRASAIEVATNQPIALKDKVKLVILPKQYLEDPPRGQNSDFMASLTNLNIQWDVYDWKPNTAPNDFRDEIERLTAKYLRSDGLL